MTRPILILSCLTVLGLAACGDTRGMRVGTGALIGGGVAAATHNDPLVGAAAGGLVGAIR